MPSDPVNYLTLDEVIEIHKAVIDAFGGPSGIRDMGLLESALYRPRSGYYEDIFQMAAALFESLIINHPFVDGNKRVAFFSTDVFLRLNGYKFQVEPDIAHQFIIELLDQGNYQLEELSKWIQSVVVSK